MATASSSVATSVDVLSASERSMVLLALETLQKSLERSVRAERNESIARLRQQDVDAISALAVKFR